MELDFKRNAIGRKLYNVIAVAYHSSSSAIRCMASWISFHYRLDQTLLVRKSPNIKRQHLIRLYSFRICPLIEIVLRHHLQSDKSIVTSVRYLSRDRKNPIVYRVTNICAKYGLVKEGECLDPETNLAKGVFVCSQIIYTLLTILHTNLLYMSYMASCIYIIFVFGIGVWNGASYYIEIFSKR